MVQERQKAPETPEEQIDENERAAEIAELSFEDDRPPGAPGEPVTHSDIDLDQPPIRAREAGMTQGETLEEGPTADDASPETLIPEDGSEWPSEPGRGGPADMTLTETDEIGGGKGLDEAELGRVEPLDEKPWNGDPTEPLKPQQFADEDFPAAKQPPSDETDEDDETEL